MYEHRNKAISAGVLAGAFWGTPFLAPLILTNFSAIEVAFIRFLFFGMISLIALPNIVTLLRQFSLKDILQALLLRACGFWLYTIMLFVGVKLTNGVIGALIVGTLPLTITLFSKPKFNYKLVFGLILILTGIFILLGIPLFFSGFKSTLTHIHPVGVIFLLLALAMWTWYAIFNVRFIIKHPHMKSLHYSSLMGILSILCILPIFLFSTNFKNIIGNPQFSEFLLWGAILGIGASWIANIFWAYCCRNSQPSIYGPLIVSETVFGLIYSFGFLHRLPYTNEFMAILLLISGAIITIKSQNEKHSYI